MTPTYSTALALEPASLHYVAPEALALSLGRGVWLTWNRDGERVILAVTSVGRLLMDGPVVLAPTTDTAATERLLWRMLNLVDGAGSLARRLH